MNFNTLHQSILRKEFRPVYFLTGDEPFFIDKLIEAFEQNVLQEEEKSFNQSIFYGLESDLSAILAEAKRYPMMAERVLVIVKEAQHLRELDLLESYLENPQPSTVLVFAYKYKKLDKRKKVAKLLNQKHVVFESKKLWENQLPTAIIEILKSKSYTAQPKAVMMLAESLGTDLSRIENEVAKLELVIPKGSEISPSQVENHIGISKDFNNFELCSAINTNQFKKALQIQAYFAASPKNHPLVLTMALLYRNFRILMIASQLKQKSGAALAKAAGISPYQTKEYLAALNHFNLKKLARIMAYLREADLRSKGVGSRAPADQILKELLFKIFYQ